MKSSRDTLPILTEEIIACERCPRLRRHCTEVARVKRRAYRDQDYWGKPVPGFGDPRARLAIVGLAPGAHGANRTGRIFTGDRSGDYLYRALYETGFASQPESRAIGDGLAMRDAYLTGPVRCAPPGNKPSPAEFARCRPFMERELTLLPRVRVVVTLGKLAHDAYLGILKDRGTIASRAAYAFGHGRAHVIAEVMAPASPVLLGCYHPSQQNTSTGRLTAAMLRDIFTRAREIIES